MKASNIEEELKYIEKVKELNKDKKLKYYIMTMGCQLNENDSEKISGMLENMNYEKTNEMKEADLVLFNTCCVRENAEEKLFGKVGEVKKQKENNGTIIAIGGCMMQEEHIVNKLKESYPYVDIIFGTHTLHKFPKDLYIALEEAKKIRDIANIDGEIIEGLPISRNDKIKASVTIMNGCNNFCSFCIVPYVRGRERSRAPKDIIEEVQNLAKEGYKEITLLGQNVNSYLVVEREKMLAKSELCIESNSESKNNKELADNILSKSMSSNGQERDIEQSNLQYEGVNSFATLLRALNKIDGIERIRFVSPHPKDFTQDVIEAIRDCEKVCKLIHLPLQSGSTSLLKEMNRKYTKEQYLELVEKIKQTVPNAVFTTDIIVGFPGETEADFEDTLDVVKKVKFEQVFMFIYSRRVGTRADKMENQIPEEIKHKRFDRLKELVESQIAENNQKYVGTVQKVLVEGTSKNNDKMLTGRTDSNKVVVFEGNADLIGNMAQLKITSEHMWFIRGEILEVRS